MSSTDYGQMRADLAHRTMKQLPTVEIIRCRDCEYYHDGKNTDGKRYVEPHCLAIGELAYGAVFEVDEDGFCSWAKRKVD